MISLTATISRPDGIFGMDRHKELLNLRQGLARLEAATRRADDEIDEWVEWAFANEAYVLEEAA
jgi:hypothetical protein